MYSDLENKYSDKAALLKELWRRLEYGPVVLRDSGNYSRVASLVSHQFPDPWPGIYFFADTPEYTPDAVKSIVLYPKSAMFHEILVGGEIFVPIVKFGVRYCKEIYPSFDETGINVIPHLSFQSASIYYKGGYITSINCSTIYSIDYAKRLMDSWMIDWEDTASEYCVYAVPDRLFHSPTRKYCSHNPFEIFG